MWEHTYAHTYPPAVWGVQRTRWESPWVGLSWDSWHTALRASRSGHDSGCSSLQTSVAPSTRKPTAQTTCPSEQSFIKMVLQRGIRLHMASVGLSDLSVKLNYVGKLKGGMDSVCFCGLWHQDISSKSFKSYKVRGGASMDCICWSSTPHRRSIGLRSGKFEGQGNTLNSLGRWYVSN